MDFVWVQGDVGLLSISMEPPVPIGGRSLEWDLMHRFGGSGFLIKYSSSGLDGLSGITITDSGLGRFNVALNSGDMSSGYGVYAYRARFTDSPQVTVSEGSVLIEP